jgi:hypothetical protein
MQFAGRDVVARKEAVGGYWKKAMDRQPMPEAIQGRIHPETGKRVYFAKDFNPKSYAAAFARWATGDDLIHPEASKAKP